MANYTEKDQLVARLLKVKDTCGKTYDEIGAHLGVTNLYAAQLFMNQAQLKPNTAIKLKEICPEISSEDLNTMQKCPMRSFDPRIMQEPLIYRLCEAMQHYGEGIKAVVNEKKGDGIMSAIDIYSDIKIVKGVQGEDRVVIVLNGKFLPHVEQFSENNTAK